MKIRISVVFIITLILGLLLTHTPRGYAQSDDQDQSGLAQAPTPSDDEVNAIAKEMYCPVCENIPLDVCPTTACHEWRELIRLKLSEGWSAQQIKDYFAAQYGDRVLAEPPRRGLNWLVYILPGVFFAVGLAVLVNVLRPKTTVTTINATTVNIQGQNEDQPLDRYQAQVEEELRKR